MAYTFAVGVLTGLATTLVVFFLKTWWERIVLPWYERRSYNDVRVDGAPWKIAAVFDDVPAERQIEFRQVGQRITGDAVTLVGRDKGKVFYVEGTILSGILYGTYASKDARSIDRGAIALRLKGTHLRCENLCFLLKSRWRNQGHRDGSFAALTTVSETTNALPGECTMPEWESASPVCLPGRDAGGVHGGLSRIGRKRVDGSAS
jgi:hypothetical protein